MMPERDGISCQRNPVDRRTFLNLAAATPILAQTKELPSYRTVTQFHTTPDHGMPGRYPGKAVRVHSEQALDIPSNRVDAGTVKTMVSEGMRALTGCAQDRDAWAQFVSPQDVVGIKVNCSGAPDINSNPELVSAIADALVQAGVAANNIYVYDRFGNQMRIARFEHHLPVGVQIVAAEDERGSILGYDPATYVEVDFFGEEDTRSNVFRLVTGKFTKIINVPTMKEHRAAGVTGCLKNISYGSFSNVARSHEREKSNTYSFIGTLASVEPLRSRTVLNIMDGLRSLWQGGPFLQDKKFLCFPKQIVVGTDPVALDRLLIDMIEEKRRAQGAPSLFDRSAGHLKFQRETDPQFNSFIREPGHVEYASQLGLGIYDKARIAAKAITL
jgi:uncharacterized protein (DUF362 family)